MTDEQERQMLSMINEHEKEMRQSLRATEEKMLEDDRFVFGHFGIEPPSRKLVFFMLRRDDESVNYASCGSEFCGSLDVARRYANLWASQDWWLGGDTKVEEWSEERFSHWQYKSEGCNCRDHGGKDLM